MEFYFRADETGRRRDCWIYSDVLWLVFIRLPLKSLFRCKSVCKAFNSVISDPLFCDYCRRNRLLLPTMEPACGGVFYTLEGRFRRIIRSSHYVGFIAGNGDNSGITPSEKELIDNFNPLCMSSGAPYIQGVIVASFGGILLYHDFPDARGQINRHYVVNPLTMEWRALPLSPIQGDWPVVGFLCKEGVSSAMGAFNYESKVIKIHNKKKMSGRNVATSY